MVHTFCSDDTRTSEGFWSSLKFQFWRRLLIKQTKCVSRMRHIGCACFHRCHSYGPAVGDATVTARLWEMPQLRPDCGRCHSYGPAVGRRTHSGPSVRHARSRSPHTLIWIERLSTLKVMLQPTVTRPVCLGVSPPSVPVTSCFASSIEIIFRQLPVFLLWGALSDEKTDLEVTWTVVFGLCQQSHSRATSPAQHVTVIYSLNSATPTLKDQVPVLVSPPGNKMAHCPRAFGSFPIAPYVTQGCRGGILTHLQINIATLATLNIPAETEIAPFRIAACLVVPAVS
jgi:hypothetical protein